jgi:TetR/AcrR family transcriptional regulator, transcriptional repressor for nem operon
LKNIPNGIFLQHMSKARQTRQFILERTAPIFNTKGYDGTSLNDLTESTGLTKGALYGHFKNKEEIALEAFRFSIAKVKQVAKAEVSAANTFKRQLTALLEFYARYVFDPPVPGGCPLLNTAIEADDHQTHLRKAVAKEVNEVIDFMALLLEKGVDAGEFKKDIKPKELAYLFFCSVEGALMVSRVDRSEEAMKVIVTNCKNILNQISK